METVSGKTYFFGDFELNGAKRTLLKCGQMVSLNSKTFDLLLVLVEDHGKVLGKNELLDRVWEDQFVEENNLTVHISALRKIFGEKKGAHQFIATVPGKGYKFVAEINQPNGEIVIENHKIERITIDEEIAATPKQRAAAHSPRRVYFVTAGLALTALLAVVLGIGYFGRNAWRAADAPVAVKRLTTNGKVQTAAISPDGKLFAYVKNDLGKSSLHLGYAAGGDEIELRAADETAYHKIAFAPDGSRLYYSASDERNPQATLYRMAAFGGAAEKLAGGIGDFHLSPDGARIAFARNNDVNATLSLMISATDGAGEQAVYTVPRAKWFVTTTVSWSPDGGRLVFACEREDETVFYDLCLLGIEDRKIERVPLENWRTMGASAWLKNGEGIFVTALPAKSFASVGHYQVIFIALPGGEVREVTGDLSSYNSYLSAADDGKSLLTVEHRQMNNLWLAPVEDLSRARQITFGSFGKCDGLWGLDFTPDGRIIYTNSDEEAQIISRMNDDGSGRKDLTAPGFVDSALVVSNDGRYVVFHSTRGGGGPGMDIWRMDADGGGNLKRLTFDNQSYQPAISGDSRYVYYVSWASSVGELRRVSVEGGEPEILTDKETRQPTFSPDGKFIAAIYRTDKRRLAVFSTETNQIVNQFEIPKTANSNPLPRFSPDGAAIVYRDGAFGYWSQPVAGGAPQRLDGLPKEEFFTHTFSKDGKHFAFVRGQQIRDVVLLQNSK